MSLTDDMSINAMRKSKDVTRNAYNIMLKAAKAGKFIGGSGVVLVLKIKNLTVHNVTKAIRDLMFRKSLGEAFMPQMVSLDELRNRGKMEIIDEGATLEMMHYFDKYCKEYDIHYSAAIDHMQEPPRYILFMNSDDTNLIMSALKRGVHDYEEDRKRGIVWESKQKKGILRESVEAKLSFFRNRLKNDDIDRGSIKNIQHGSIAR